MYKIIACDLDETLLNSERKVSRRNIEAVAKARALGVKFVLATGRGYRTVGGTLAELGLNDLPGEYVISFNGGAITENKDSRLLRLEGLDFAKADELYRRGLDYDVCIHAYTRDDVYAYNLVEDELRYVKGRMPMIETSERSLDFLKGQDIVKILYMNTNYQYLKKIQSDLADLTTDIDVSFSSNRYIEFNRQGVNKGNGLLALADMLGVKREETIAIGDNFNDLSMIQAAGLGIGVQNTAEDMKPLCDVITTATNDEDAIAEVIERFIL